MDPAGTLLLRTKLHAPRRDPQWVVRPRLLTLLGAGPPCRLTLIVAPAGFGKTTLASQWLAARSGAIAWLSLDEDDGSPQRFFDYLAAAIRAALPDACAATVRLLASAQPPPPRHVADTLLNDLAALATPLTIALDDYHRITDETVHAELFRIIGHLPDGVDLVVTSRVDPPWPLGRLRALRQLAEVRAAHLRFTVEETRHLLAPEGMAGAFDGMAEAIHVRTEGWVAGLQLAQISLRAADDPAAAAERLNAADHFMMEYLADEVIAQQPLALREFLLTSALPERFCAPLCDALLGGAADRASGSEALLAELDRRNLFLIPLDGERTWYRYHHLFRDLLRSRLRADQGSAGVARLHRRASRWFAEQGLVEESVRHALLADRPLDAARVIERQFHRLMDLSPTFLDRHPLISLLPPELAQGRPALLVAQAYRTYNRWDFATIAALADEAQGLLDGVAAPPDADDQEALRGDLDLLHGIAHFWAGDVAATHELTRRALTRIPRTHAYAHNMALSYYAGALVTGGDVAAGIGLLDAKLAEGPDPAGVYANHTLAALAVLDTFTGDLDRLAADAERLAADWPMKDPYWTAWGHYFRGRVHYERGELDSARTRFVEVVSRRYSANERPYHESLVILAAIAVLEGDASRARAYADQARAYAAEANNALLRQGSIGLDAELAALESDRDVAARAVDALDSRADGGTSFFLEIPRLRRARLLIARATAADLAVAVAELESFLRDAERVHNVWLTIRVRAIRGLALRAQGRPEAALDSLASAVALAAPGGFIRTFLDLGPPMVDLLRALAARDGRSTHLDRLLAVVAMPDAPVTPDGDAASTSPTAARRARDLESLTHRERQILSGLARGLTNKEIGVELTISAETVKRHVSNIFDKLGAANRWQAVRRAQVAGLLPSSWPLTGPDQPDPPLMH